MTEDSIIKVTDEAKRTALIDNQKYLQEYQRSIKNPEEFRAEHGTVSYTHLTLPTKA